MIIAHLARVCYPFHPFGGLEQHVYRLTQELARLGHTVHLFTQPPDPFYFQQEAVRWRGEVIHHYLPYQTIKLLRRNSIPDRLVNYPLFSLRLAREVRHFTPAPDVIHAHGLAAFGVAMQPLPGVPLVLNPHGMEEFKNVSRLKQGAYAPFRAMLRTAAQRSAAIIATDRALIPEVSRYLKAPDSKTRLIPNAVDLEEIDAKLASAKPVTQPADTRLILSVGRLEQNKGFDIGLQALSQISTAQAWRWVLVGEGSQREALESQAARLGLKERVYFAGKITDEELYGYYRRADIFLHPTLYEGSSLVTLEALACGIPVVASATGGIPDKVFETGEFENGRLASPGDATALATHLATLLEMETGKRHELGQNGRRLVQQRFSWEAAGKATVNLYKEFFLIK
ncbi:MAG: glycosyltransferase family 4 protein [Chloroflexi bacterium]|uniref:Glycosyltransferase family 4 protein n=1 Tax=Candidatus Chlorohelix allophototropha TaxID=3003348 RepID=A0A8T7M952_9CHLR|nr:glycosyltransferase family 4 protein [Chloroflexota bacterium]WJW68465.1 glycosyltransferase family 4 protein [Chloroflexota bacterium L227-S17]